jgi:predicted site-specific integrase-resolvase
MSATPKWIPLKVWLELNYGEHQPHRNTIHNWIRDGKIQPAPKKHGRDYYVKPDAEYVDQVNAKPSLLSRLGKAA